MAFSVISGRRTTWYGSSTGPDRVYVGGAAEGDHRSQLSVAGRRRRRSSACGDGRAAGGLLLDPVLQGGERLAGQHQVALLEDVVGVELGDRGDLHPFDVPGAAVEDRVVAGQADQDRPAVEGAVAGLGLGLADRSVGLGLGQVGPADRPQGVGDDLGLAASRRGARPSMIRAWPSWNFDRMAIRMAARTAFLGMV